MTSNIREFEASSLPPDLYERAIEYVCYERNFYYIYTGSYGLETFPLVHLDRFLGWRHALGAEPLYPLHNGLADLLDTYVRDSGSTPVPDFRTALHDLFSQGHKVSVNMWVTHTDGTPYVTSVLLEGMDESGTVYFTKVNETLNRTCSPLTFAQLMEKVAPDEDGTIGLTVIKHSDVIQRLAGLAPAAAFDYLFHDLYGYRFVDGQLTRHGTPVAADQNGFDELLAHLDSHEDDVLVDGAVPKQQQFRLNKHVRNRFAPIQFYLDYVLTTPDLAASLSDELVARTRAEMSGVDRALNDVQKFASLLVQRPESRIYRMYVDSVRALRSLLPAYQQVNMDVLAALAGGGSEQAMETDWIPRLFGGYLPDDVIAKVIGDYPAHRDVPLTQLGLDSMAVMGLVLNLEQIFGLQIDYATFDIATLRTMGSIEQYLAEARAGANA